MGLFLNMKLLPSMLLSRGYIQTKLVCVEKILWPLFRNWLADPRCAFHTSIELFYIIKSFLLKELFPL